MSDWSSDVCSSDLDAVGRAENVAGPDVAVHQAGGRRLVYEVLEPRAEALERAMGRRRQAAGLAGDAAHHQQALVAVEVAPVPGPGIGLRQSADHRVARKAIGLGGKRSEESRVGKEWVNTCRFRWSQ